MTVNSRPDKQLGKDGQYRKDSLNKKSQTNVEKRAGRIVLSPVPLDYLGVEGYVVAGTPLETEEDIVKLIRKGITKKYISHLIKSTNIPANEMAEIMEITPTRLSSMKPGTMMEKSQSEKAIQIARLYTLGEQVFEGREDFEKWMNGCVPSLGKKRPKHFLDTITGINFLMDELNRMRYGVYS